MSIEQNKLVARRFFEDAYNTGNLELLDQLLAPGYVDQKAPPGTPAGPEGIKGVISLFRSAFPDLRFTIEDQVAEGDKVVTRYTFAGTHKGSLMGIPATGRHVSISGISLYRIANGKMQDAWIEYDMLGLMQQIGVVPAAV
jgi:steroid delta-isomerase-like uncharacterized protein